MRAKMSDSKAVSAVEDLSVELYQLDETAAALEQVWVGFAHELKAWMEIAISETQIDEAVNKFREFEREWQKLVETAKKLKRKIAQLISANDLPRDLEPVDFVSHAVKGDNWQGPKITQSWF
jgi:predicted transcriptional regulator